MKLEEDFVITEEDEKVLKKIRSGVQKETRVDPITGRKEKPKAMLNKRKLSKHEMDEFFMDF